MNKRNSQTTRKDSTSYPMTMSPMDSNEEREEEAISFDGSCSTCSSPVRVFRVDDHHDKDRNHSFLMADCNKRSTTAATFHGYPQSSHIVASSGARYVTPSQTQQQPVLQRNDEMSAFVGQGSMHVEKVQLAESCDDNDDDILIAETGVPLPATYFMESYPSPQLGKEEIDKTNENVPLWEKEDVQDTQEQNSYDFNMPFPAKRAKRM